MKLKNWLDKHPLFALLSSVMTACATVAGVVIYFASEKLELQEQAWNVEKQRYEDTVKSLETRVVSIERGVATSGDLFDLTRLVITSDQTKSLSDDVHHIVDQDFYWAEPAGNSWRTEKTTELELLRRLMGAEIADMAAAMGLKQLSDESPIHLWTTDDPKCFRATVNVRSVLGESQEMNLFPYVAVQRMSHTTLSRLMGGFIRHELDDTTDAVKNVEQLLAELDAPDATNVPPVAKAALTPQPTSVPGPPNDELATKEKLIDALSNVFDADLGGVLLLTQLQGGFSMATGIDGASFHVSRVQKKGHVLYLRGALMFKNAQIVGASGGTTPVRVDHEIFFISQGKDFLVVKVWVPSTDGRSTAHAWVAKWLEGLRVPLA